MDKFTEKEKQELLEDAKSESLRKDFQYLANNRFQFHTADGSIDTDKILHFLNEMNALANHTLKPFKKITGNNFRI